MKRLLAVLFVSGLVATGLVAGAQAGPGRAGRYIVVVKDSAGPPAAVANDHARRHAVEVGHVYSTVLGGYAGVIPESRLDHIRSDSRVAFVEADGVASIAHHRDGHSGGPPAPDPEPSPSPTEEPDPEPSPSPTEEPDPEPDPDPNCPGSQTIPWGIDRVGATVSSTLAGNCSGAVGAIDAYVIDTGIDGHTDLDAVQAVNFAGGPNKDCNGHGTHVAGTIGARDNTSDVVGVAPGVKLIGVKVLGCSGSGSYSGVIAGIDWVTQRAQASGRPSVANMSLGGGASSSLDNAVKDSVSKGVFYSLAAGNEGTDACTRSPARLGKDTAGALTVGATDISNNDPSWSNYGPCVEIWAPGVSILSTARGGGTTTMSGTSMAAPHVAGAGALAGGSPSQAESALKNAVTTPGTTANNGVLITLLNVGGF